MSTTISRWLDLPTSGARFAGDQPLGAGLLAIASSNATIAARENGLRTIWESRGSTVVYQDLFTPGDPFSFNWDGVDAEGGWSRHCGVHRVRLYGEGITVPKLRLYCRAEAPSSYTIGVILAAMPGDGVPNGRLMAWDTTTATTPTDLDVEVALSPADLTAARVGLRGDDGLEEGGEVSTVAVFVGAWCTSGAALSKGSIYGVTVSLVEP